jgi:adenylate cyclase
VKAVVAAPILDRKCDVIGVLYGDRRLPTGSGLAPEVTKVEAMLVELLATSVAAGLARVAHEQAALKARVQFEQFFTPQLSRELASHPDLLSGREAEITVMFCDIRGFSRISERLGPAKTGEWIGEVLGCLSDCALEHHGVLVDYLGDELMTMWGAPQKQPDHARLACRSALAMMQKLPALNAAWQESLGELISVGIGINTGVARVGNTGSHRKFKYGPLGGPVNLASRAQGASKYLKTAILATGDTVSQLDGDFLTRRLGKVRVINIAEAVELYEIAVPGRPEWVPLREKYEAALAEFEQQKLREAAGILGELLVKYPEDGPCAVLLSRALDALDHDPAEFDPVWDLPGK